MISSLGAQHYALMQRQMKFGALALRGILAMAVGMAVGIAAAIAGVGYWALVAQQGASAAAGTIILWWRSGWRPAAPLSIRKIRHSLSFGGFITVSNFVGYFNANLDVILLGRRFGEATVGLSSRGPGPVEQAAGPGSHAHRQRGLPGAVAADDRSGTVQEGFLHPHSDGVLRGVPPAHEHGSDRGLGGEDLPGRPLDRPLLPCSEYWLSLASWSRWHTFSGQFWWPPESRQRWRPGVRFLPPWSCSPFCRTTLGRRWRGCGLCVQRNRHTHLACLLCRPARRHFGMGVPSRLQPICSFTGVISIAFSLLRAIWQPSSAVVGILISTLLCTGTYVGGMFCIPSGRRFLRDSGTAAADIMRTLKTSSMSHATNIK
jgi:hypothetical protein